METRETKNCPYCGEEILAVAKKCKHCGEWLPEQPKPKRMIPCPICGEEVEEGTEVCPHCNEPIYWETDFSNRDSIETIEENEKPSESIENNMALSEYQELFNQDEHQADPVTSDEKAEQTDTLEESTEKRLPKENKESNAELNEEPLSTASLENGNETSNVNKSEEINNNTKIKATETRGESYIKSLFIMIGVAVVIIIIIMASTGSCSSKHEPTAALASESSSNEKTEIDKIQTEDTLYEDAYPANENSTDNTGSESHTSNSETGGWHKKYAQDEFGNTDTSRPYIYQIWSGRRNDTFDCGLGIRITREFLQFTITEEYMHPNLAGAIVTGQMNGQKFQIEYDEANNESVFIYNQEELTKVLSVLNTDGTLMLSFRRTDSFDETHNYLFTIYGSTNVYGAIKELLYDGTLPQN